jgi:hypothetical protein
MGEFQTLPSRRVGLCAPPDTRKADKKHSQNKQDGDTNVINLEKYILLHHVPTFVFISFSNKKYILVQFLTLAPCSPFTEGYGAKHKTGRRGATHNLPENSR